LVWVWVAIPADTAAITEARLKTANIPANTQKKNRIFFVLVCTHISRVGPTQKRKEEEERMGDSPVAAMSDDKATNVLAMVEDQDKIDGTALTPLTEIDGTICTLICIIFDELK
jgi:hypothetical protein